MRLTEQYLKRLIRQTIREGSRETDWDHNERMPTAEEDQALGSSGLRSQRYGKIAKARYGNAREGIKKAYELLQGTQSKDQLQDCAEILYSLMQGIDNGSITLD